MHGLEKATETDCARCGVSRCRARDSRDGNSLRGWRLTLSSTAIFLAPVLTPMVLVFLPAVAVLASPRRLIWYGFIFGLMFSWILMSAIHYNERLTALQNLIKQAVERSVGVEKLVSPVHAGERLLRKILCILV